MENCDPAFSDKTKSSEKITLVHEDKIIVTEDKNAKILNSLFRWIRNFVTIQMYQLLETHLIHKVSISQKLVLMMF